MRHNELEVGKVYLYDTATNWGDSTSRTYNRYAARVESLYRYEKKHRYSASRSGESMELNAKGRYVKVTKIGDPQGPEWERKDVVEYVEPRYLRGEYAALKRQAEERRERARKAREEEDEEEDEANAATTARGQALAQRVTALGVGIQVDTGDRYTMGRRSVRGHLDEASLVALLDRLEKAELAAGEEALKAFMAGIKAGDREQAIGPQAQMILWRNYYNRATSGE